MYYLMIKKAYPSGLMYLCKTSNEDPITYTGSGTYWLRHIKKNKSRIVTCIIGKFNLNEELRKVGLAFSIKHDICKSKKWANIVPEAGDGGNTLHGRKKFYNIKTNECKMFHIGMEPTGWQRQTPKALMPKKGFKRYHNPKTNKMVHIYPGDEIPEGYIKGGIKGKFGYGPKTGATITYNNGKRKILLSAGDKIPEGFIKGSGLQTTLGKIAYHHTLTKEVRFLDNNEEIPENFVKGGDKKNGSPEWKPITVNKIKFRNIQEACDYFDLSRGILLKRLDSDNNLRPSKDFKTANKKVKINNIIFNTIELATKHFDITRYKLLTYYKVEYL